MNGAGVTAHRDVGCFSVAKFLYVFPHPVSHDIVAGFEGCAVTVRRFSELIPLGKDLVTIRQAGTFSASFVIGGRRAVVSFEGDAKNPSPTAIEAFDRRLGAAGYDRVLHPEAPGLSCGQCPAGALKGCSRHGEGAVLRDDRNPGDAPASRSGSIAA